ncbi:uncharacterized protein CLUP02_15949 [Colletotrichum lupini]|uniref:Uncharacterized protein n=1 Tax=Colletotrichum lupini TaxID=145971 RepID=A0A9Q8T6X1_9PEZI|nr:uncharacterized protein CLUP02_15949 [Colletotrichum lupini]UQC90419.1 hypothetical protein CLUP02_15949 [Colletotrichum lupini]
MIPTLPWLNGSGKRQRAATQSALGRAVALACFWLWCGGKHFGSWLALTHFNNQAASSCTNPPLPQSRPQPAPTLTSTSTSTSTSSISTTQTSLQSVKLELANIHFWANLRRGILFPIPAYLPCPTSPPVHLRPGVTADGTPSENTTSTPRYPKIPHHPPLITAYTIPSYSARHFDDGRAFPAATDLTCALPVVIELSDFPSLSLPMLPITDTR